MIKAHKHSQTKIIRRTSRVYLPWLNLGKATSISQFLDLCRDTEQYFIDLFWQRKDFSSTLADLETIHRATSRFGITTRLSQALAKQAKETLRSQREKISRKPELSKHIVTLYSHFVKLESFTGSFDIAVNLIGSGAPRMTLPCKATKHLNALLEKGYTYSKTIHLGRTQSGTIFVDFVLEKPKPQLRKEGKVLGMDSNYKAGLVFSDHQIVAKNLYPRIQSFSKRQKHTHEEIRSLLGQAVKQLDFTGVKMLILEHLQSVKSNKRGKFPRTFNRRLSHWLYAYTLSLLERRCEELGVQLVLKNPAYTSLFCRTCGRWDKRNRRGDLFKCIHCGYQENADYNASKNLELLGLAGVYGLRSLKSPSDSLGLGQPLRQR